MANRDASADTVGKKPEPLQEWQRDMARAVPDAVMRDVIRDAFNGISKSASMIPDRVWSEDKPRASGGGSVPLRQPPGVDLIDKMVEAQSRNERLAAIKQRIENAWIEARFDKGPRIETEWNPFDRENMKK
jgi:hypothetical protein